ncbi:Protein CBR-SYX-18 [Caenorhabditis briggsae]|uniref:Protein CBR-SYX-18 n=1 Tax=Caenorhabditis briggsae TaxID=6238 RepID=A8XUI0_CAEBR|nr:Protein CBR-SYX-18 [Caenorhabditis briggsae]CAP36305.1 Protein CBR-SYX-18 [Caenorhabditis briggsae]
MAIDRPPYSDRSEQFKTLATSIEQKHIRRHNEKPGVSRRDENRPSSAYTNISNVVHPFATEMYLFRKMLEDRSQDYIFATPAYSKMSSEERECFDADVKVKLSQFESFINQLGKRVHSSDGLRNASERGHLTRVQEGLRVFLKETVDLVSLLKKEHLKRLQVKNRSLADEVKTAKQDGHAFKYLNGLDELLFGSDFEYNPKLIGKLKELSLKYPCLQFKPPKEEQVDQDFDMVEEITSAKIVNDNDDDGWGDIDGFQFKEVPKEKPKEKPEESRDCSSILFNESVRNRRRLVAGSEQDELRESYERWKSEQGEQFNEQFQQQTAIIKEEFVKADRDDEIEKLEQQISEIQSLASVFSEKIMDQERDIDLINDLALHTSENLIDGNEWIRKAITNSAFQRVWFLFCIVVLTFTLLFLDWYNP